MLKLVASVPCAETSASEPVALNGAGAPLIVPRSVSFKPVTAALLLTETFFAASTSPLWTMPKSTDGVFTSAIAGV